MPNERGQVGRGLDLDDGSLTENTPGAYHISAIPNAPLDGRGGHPENIIFMTCDAFGVLPPVARLSAEQAMYHFISAYTARVAGTEKGGTEPAPVFGFEVHEACPDVPKNILRPRERWADKVAYVAQAAKLAAMFHENFRAYTDQVAASVREAGPRSPSTDR